MAYATGPDDVPRTLGDQLGSGAGGSDRLRTEQAHPSSSSHTENYSLGKADMSQNRQPSASVKRKQRDDGPLAVFCAWVVDHQIGIAVNLLLLLNLTHLCFPRARRHTRKFFELSYYDPSSGRYNVGWDDMSLVVFWVVLFTGLRVGCMEYILTPLARWGGVKTQKGRVRFAEQAWIFVYPTFSFSLGLYIYYHSSYWLSLREMWTHWPDRTMDGLTKWYYLVQFAFWIQQNIVVNIEERRKDYHQMFTHHLITCALVFGSYGYHQTKVGNVILVLMDVVDIVLPLAKMLKYMRFQLACDIAFGIFMLTWFVARHVLYNIVTWSVWAQLPAVIKYGCYAGRSQEIVGPFPPPDYVAHLFEPFRDPAGIVCWDHKIYWAFLTMLFALQIIALIWFGMIIRVALRVLQGGTAEDSRSDDEGEEEEEDAKELERERLHVREALEVPPLEEEVGVEAINLKGRSNSARRYKKAVGTASGATIPGHSDRKELLGRIGCDKTA